jgi:predicted nucleic acid-binding protein
LPFVILDSSIYIGLWEQGRHSDSLDRVLRRFLIRHSSVVLSELRRGARTTPARRIVTALHRLAKKPWEPLADDWWQAGKLVRVIGDAEHWDINRRRGFQNDALIALTARRYGAFVWTDNIDAFTRLQRHVDFGLLGP